MVPLRYACRQMVTTTALTRQPQHSLSRRPMQQLARYLVSRHRIISLLWPQTPEGEAASQELSRRKQKQTAKSQQRAIPFFGVSSSSSSEGGGGLGALEFKVNRQGNRLFCAAVFACKGGMLTIPVRHDDGVIWRLRRCNSHSSSFEHDDGDSDADGVSNQPQATALEQLNDTPTRSGGGSESQRRMHRRSLQSPLAFWKKQADRVHWFQPYHTLLGDGGGDGNSGKTKRQAWSYRWFEGGLVNISYSCLDAHVMAGLGDCAAIHYDSPLSGGCRRTISYRELLRQTSCFAYFLSRRAAVEVGDRVLIYMPMVPEVVVAMLACARIGAIHTVVFGGFAAKQLAIRIQHAQPKVIVAASCGIEPRGIVDYKKNIDAALEMVMAAAAHSEEKEACWFLSDAPPKAVTPLPKLCVLLQRPQLPAVLHPDRDISWQQAMACSSPTVDAVPVESNHPLYISYTSGTTGEPKGIVRDHAGQLVAGKFAFDYVYNCKAGDCFFCAADIGWILGHSCAVYGSLANGCASIIYEGKPVQTPDAGAFWRVVETYKVKCMFTAATAIRAIRREDEEARLLRCHDLSSLDALYVAGERMDLSTYRWITKHLREARRLQNCPPAPVIDNWWQTETGWPMSSIMRSLDQPSLVKEGFCGQLVPGWDIRVLHDDGNEAECGGAGKVAVKLPLPPGALTSLWQAEDTFVNTYFRALPGFYDTGDFGVVDDEGYLQILSRTDDIINIAGHRLSVAAMEEILMEEPGVVEAVVVGVEDSLKGHVPLAFIVHRDSNIYATRGEEDAGYTACRNKCDQPENQKRVRELSQRLVQRVRDELGAIACLRECVLVERLPKTRSGKVLRGSLAALADGREHTVPPTIEDEAALHEIEEQLAGQLGRYPQ